MNQVSDPHKDPVLNAKFSPSMEEKGEKQTIPGEKRSLIMSLYQKIPMIFFYVLAFLGHLVVVSRLVLGIHDFSKMVVITNLWVYMGVITCCVLRQKHPELARAITNFVIVMSVSVSCIGIGWTLLWSSGQRVSQDEKIWLVALYVLNSLCTFVLSMGIGVWAASVKAQKLMDELSTHYSTVSPWKRL